MMLKKKKKGQSSLCKYVMFIHIRTSFQHFSSERHIYLLSSLWQETVPAPGPGKLFGKSQTQSGVFLLIKNWDINVHTTSTYWPVYTALHTKQERLLHICTILHESWKTDVFKQNGTGRAEGQRNLIFNFEDLDSNPFLFFLPDCSSQFLYLKNEDE